MSSGNVCHIEHTRHRSIDNFASNLFAEIIAYNLMPKKPEMNIEIIDKSRLIASALRRTHVKLCFIIEHIIFIPRTSKRNHLCFFH